MALKIRLARGGTKKRPFYRIVIAEASSPRDGRFVERIGSYNPMLPTGHENRLVLDGERAKYWMSKGAKPTLRVHKMMAGIGLLDSPEIREQPKKSAFGKKRQEREDAAAEAAEAAAAEAAEAAAAAPAEEAPAEEVPAEEAPAEEVPAEEVPAEEVPAEEVPAEEAPAEEVPAEDKAE
jgi:small subunit ribosomal protein S16